jgi:intein/homing endonuclease
MMLFGFEFKRKVPLDKQLVSFAPRDNEDGAVIVAAGGSFGTYIDLDGTVRTEAELVTKYREMSLQPECDSAIDEIVNEAMSIDEETIVDINLDKVNISDNIKKVIIEEFHNCLDLLDFNKYAYDILRRWYIDGRLYYHVIIDENDTSGGIKELRYIDPRKIRKIREVARKRVQGGSSGGIGGGDATITRVANEYFVFNDKGFNYGNKPSGPATNGLKIAVDSILHVVSGLTDNGGTMVLSYLHKGIKSLNQLRTLEDSMVIYRIARAPERRIWYIDVGNLPKIKAEQYVREIMVKHKNRLIYDAASGEVRDDRKFMCLALDTRIPLLDGRTLPLEEIIAEYEAGKKNWVYSCDPMTGKFAPGPVEWAGITKRDSDVVRVTLDNGKSVVCTPDHKFPVWNKGFVEAQHLAIGESIIPGYRRMSPIEDGGREYEQIYQNDSKKWVFTHRAVSKWKDENGLREEFSYDADLNHLNKRTVHHFDLNRYNNNPENLVMMNNRDHWKYHSVFCNSDELKIKNAEARTLLYTDEIYGVVEKCARDQMRGAEALKLINEKIDHAAWMSANADTIMPKRAIVPWKFLYRDLLKVCGRLGHKNWKSYSAQFASKIVHNKKQRSTLKRYVDMSNNTQWRESLSVAAKNRTSVACKSWKITAPDGQIEIIENLSAFCRASGLDRNNIKGDFGSRGYHAEQLHNHRVVSVEFLNEKMDVGCLTIDFEKEAYDSHHTFQLDCGIYSKNTTLEDYWLPRREGGRGTEVTTLPGGQNLGQMDDVLYFQKKFLQTLNVPVSRLNSDALFSVGRATEVTRDEVKFARFIIRLRSRFSIIFNKLLEKQLVLKGVMSLEDWQDIEQRVKYNYSKDNYFTELKDGEVLTSRVELARNLQDMVGKYYSNEWVRKNVLQQSDEDIEKMDAEIQAELDSGDPRWQPQDMMNPDENPDENPDDVPQDVGSDSDAMVDDDKAKKYEEVRKAKQTIEMMKKKSKENRSMQDQSKYKAAVQILAKNPEIAKSIGATKGTAGQDIKGQ